MRSKKTEGEITPMRGSAGLYHPTAVVWSRDVEDAVPYVGRQCIDSEISRTIGFLLATLSGARGREHKRIVPLCSDDVGRKWHFLLL